MSFFDDASLAFLPSGGAGKDGKAYSIKPTDGTGDFTFSRGSNLTATRVGPTGLIEKGRENLLLQSNQFDTTWSATNASVTSGQSGYDGSLDAWLLTASSTSNARVQQNKSFSGVHTFSVYAKSGTNDFLYLRSNGALTYEAYFNLSNGTTSNSSNLITENITSVGDGWYRCSITFNASSSFDVRAYVVDGFGTINVTNGSTIYIQDAQLEVGLAATDYIESGASTGKAGLLENEPRFDYSGGATCPSLLLEPQRVNLVPYSEYIQGLALTDLTPTPNATTSPEGLQNAYKVLTGTAGSEQISYQETGTSGNIKTQSVYIKADSGVQWIRLIQIRNGFSNSASAWFDIQNGVKGSKEENGTTSVVDDATKIEDAGNGWYRLTLVCTDSTNNTIFDTRVRTAIADGSGTRVSNGSYFVWGLQMESDASYPTSYIPNHSGGSATRTQDNPAQLDVTGLTSTYNTLYAEFEVSSITNQGKISLSDNSQSNRMTIYQNTDDLMLLLNAGGSAQTSITASSVLSVGTNFKVIAKHQNGSHALFINGTKIGEETSTTPTGLNRLRYGNELDTNDTQKFLGNIKQTLVFPEALSDADCITLTT